MSDVGIMETYHACRINSSIVLRNQGLNQFVETIKCHIVQRSPASFSLAVDISILGEQHLTDVSIARLSSQMKSWPCLLIKHIHPGIKDHIYRMVIVEGRCIIARSSSLGANCSLIEQKYSELGLVRYNGLVWSNIAVPFFLPSYIYDPCLVLTLIMIFSKYSWNSSSLHFSLRPNFQNQNQLAQLHHWSGSIWEYENYFRFSWMLLNLRMESMAMLRVFTMLKVQTVAELLDQRWVTSVDWFLFFVHRGETSKVFCQ